MAENSQPDNSLKRALEDVLERAKKDPAFFHKLVFQPDSIVSELPDSRELKAAVYGIDPGGLFGAIERLNRDSVMRCAETCGAGSCQDTCGVASCNHTCLSSCHGTCGGLSCGFTTHAKR